MSAKKRPVIFERGKVIGTDTPTSELPIVEPEQESTFPQTEKIINVTYIRAKTASAAGLANRAFNKLTQEPRHADTIPVHRKAFNTLLALAKDFPNTEFPKQLGLCIRILKNFLSDSLPKGVAPLIDKANTILREEIQPKL
ncbi:hypothetical protein ACFL3C_02490 [Patescibacteria group bacterium]